MPERKGRRAAAHRVEERHQLWHGRHLHRAGHPEAHPAADGEAAFASLEQNPPDLMILDVMLPRLNGFEVLRRLRAEGIETPAVILTMSDAESDLSAALRAGVRCECGAVCAVRHTVQPPPPVCVCARAHAHTHVLAPCCASPHTPCAAH